MHSFDDYYYFYLVVKHGSFSAASEASAITKSKLSRRILDLEAQFNVTLIQRSTRHFKVTPLGQEFFEACRQIIEQADEAQSILTRQKNEPQGLIKISCPPVMMKHQIRPLLSHFLKKYPKVQIELQLNSQRIDVLQDDIDLAIRTNFTTNEDSSIIVRDVVRTTHCLVASPELLKGHTIEHITELSDYPSIVLGTQKQQHFWHLHNLKTQENIHIPLIPRIKSNDLLGAYFAAVDGLGIADLPFLTVQQDLASGKLIHLLPDWCSNIGTVQIVYAARKGQPMVMETLIEYLVKNIRTYADHYSGYLH